MIHKYPQEYVNNDIDDEYGYDIDDYFEGEGDIGVGKRIVRDGQLILEDLKKLEPGTILVFHSRWGKEVVWFKFVRGKLIYYVDAHGQPKSTHLTDRGCLPYDNKDNWNLWNWVTLFEKFTIGQLVIVNKNSTDLGARGKTGAVDAIHRNWGGDENKTVINVLFDDGIKGLFAAESLDVLL